MIFILILISSFFLIKYKQSLAWLLVYFITNPAGISEVYLTKNLLGGVFYIDIFFVLAFTVVIAGNYKFKWLTGNRSLISIIVILFIFSLYKVFIWGLIVPDYDTAQWFRYVLIRERDTIYGFLFIIPVYLFALKSLKTFLHIIIIFGFILILISLISMITGFDIIPIRQVERYKESGIIRYLLMNYGLISFIIPASFIVFIGKIGIRYKNILFVGGILTTTVIIVSLTKGLYLGLLGTALAAIFLSIRLLKIEVTKGTRRGLIFLGILALSLIILFPNYSKYSSRAFNDIFLLAATGETSAGETSRYWQIPALAAGIAEKPLFGTGHGYEQLSKEYDINQFDATDLPLLAHIMQYGLIGILIYLLYYFKIFSLIKDSYRKLKALPREVLTTHFRYELIFVVASVAFFIGYIMKIFQVFIELTRGSDRIELSIYTGLLLAAIERIRMKLKNPELLHPDNDPGNKVTFSKV